MSAERKPVIKKLSRGVLDLKFMKKSKEKAEIQKDNEERQHLYSNQLSALHSSAEKVVILRSHYDVRTYLPCRLSFGGIDPDIEKLTEPLLTGLYKVPKEEPIKNEEEADVTEEEMTKYYSIHKKIKEFREMSSSNFSGNTKEDIGLKRNSNKRPRNKGKFSYNDRSNENNIAKYNPKSSNQHFQNNFHNRKRMKLDHRQ